MAASGPVAVAVAAPKSSKYDADPQAPFDREGDATRSLSYTCDAAWAVAAMISAEANVVQ